MINKQYEDSILLSHFQKLPTSAKQNRTKSGKKKPLNLFICHSFYSKPFDFKSVKRTLHTYYKVGSIGKSLTLTNEVTGNSIRVNFQPDQWGYISIRVYKNDTVFCCPMPKTNVEFYRKLVTAKLF